MEINSKSEGGASLRELCSNHTALSKQLDSVLTGRAKEHFGEHCYLDAHCVCEIEGEGTIPLPYISYAWDGETPYMTARCIRCGGLVYYPMCGEHWYRLTEELLAG